MGETLSDKILCSSCSPLIFDHVIDKWPLRHWTLQTLATKFPDISLTAKISSRSTEGFQWESECEHLEVNFQDFYEWIEGISRDENPLQSYSKELYSCYIDYKYMKDAFQKYPHVMKEIDWGVLGLTGRDGNNSTIWIGSEGCYTNCHYDTYGFNLVAQIYGRKRWILFPPSDTNKLYPTRLPYEESSVFSSVHIVNPDLKKHLLFKECHPYIVDLQPGQVLYVPRHWWHHVECLEPAISINTWVEMEEDNESRCHEAITKFLFMNMYDEHQKILASNDDKVLTPNSIPWLNPYEELTEPSENLALLNVAWSKVKSFENRSSETSGIQLLAQHAKTFVLKQDDVRGIKRRWEYANENSLSLVKESQSQESSQSVVMVTELSSLDMDLFLKLYTKKQRTSSNHDVVCSLSTWNNEDENDIRPSRNSNYTVSMETFTKCLLHPDVINVLSSVLNKHLNYQIK